MRAREDDRAALLVLAAIAELIRARAADGKGEAQAAADLLRRGRRVTARPSRMLWFYLAHCAAGLSKRQIARLTRTHCEVVRALIARVEDARDEPAVDAEVAVLEEAVARIVAPAWAQAG